MSPAAPALPVPAGHADATAIHAVPAVAIAGGFRLLVLREFAAADEPAGFAVIEQHLLRPPPREIRHGLAFALAFGPEAMAWLCERIGRPAARDEAGAVVRNARWPLLTWHRQARTWPDGLRTTEWSADIRFPDPATGEAFARAFAAPLAGTAAP